MKQGACRAALVTILCAAAVAGATRSLGDPDPKTDLKSIALFYQTYNAEKGKPPQSVEVFLNYIKRDAPQLEKWIKDGYYKVLANVKPGQEKIVAYQDRNAKGGKHLVVLANGSVQEMSADALRVQIEKQK